MMLLPRILLLSLLCPTVALAQQPDSVVVRNAQGDVISRSLFVTRGQVTIATLSSSKSEGARTVSCFDRRGRLTSKSEYSLRHGAQILTRRTDYQLSDDGKPLSALTSTPGGHQQMVAYAYAPSGRLSCETTYVWDATEMDWTPAERLDYSYSRQPLPLPSREFALRSRSVWDSGKGLWTVTDEVELYDYDSQGRIVQRCVQAGADADSCTTLSYDDSGRLATSRAGVYASDGYRVVGVETIDYDKADRISARRVADSSGRLVSTATYYYSARAHRPSQAKSRRLLTEETLSSTTGNRLCLSTFYYDSLGRKVGVATDSVFADGRDSHYEKALLYSPSGRLASTVEASFTPSDTAYADDDLPFALYTVTLVDEGGNAVMAFDYPTEGDSRPLRSRQWRNAYDASGRLASSVCYETGGDGGFVRRDSVAVAYDIPSARSAAAADSVSRIGRVWMRLAGFFSHLRKAAPPDSAAAGVCAADSLPDSPMTERLVYEWDKEWKCTRRVLREYDGEGRIKVEYSYCMSAPADGWRMVRKEVFLYDGAEPAKAEVYAPAADGGRLSLVEVRKSHYY
ncbi:MAG: hypothetical protein ACI35Q_09170 [Marinilabiliaceae bacterium]